MLSAEKSNILIVDDKVNNIFALEEILSNPNRNLMRAISGKEALRTVLKREVDLIILDVQMPDMDGFEVAQILKSNKKTRDIPIIFASAEKKEHKFMMQGFEEGAVDYLHKPLDPQITEAKVSVLLQFHLQKKELIEKNAALEKYALLINNSADLICIINPKTLQFEEVNHAVKNMLGYSTDEIKGTSILSYLPEKDGHNVRDLSTENKGRFSLETQIFSKDRIIKWLHWNIVFKNGLWFANARDITRIKEVEEIKNYVAIVVKQSKDAIYLHNAEGIIISWNEGAEKIYGFSEGEALGMEIRNIVPEDLMLQMLHITGEIVKGNKVQSLELKRVTKDKEVIDVLFSASGITDLNGNITSVAITERDITQQKKADEEITLLNADLKRNVVQLEVTNKELESFSYSVSHDLRAPVRAISGFSRIMQEEYKTQLEEGAKSLIEKIQDNAKRMNVLIDDLLAFSKLGRQPVKKTWVDFNEMVNRVVKDIRTGIPDLKAIISIGSLKSNNADNALLYQVFVNLVSNAIKYSAKKEQPVIQIDFAENAEEFIYFIKDNGSGFDMQYSHKLFGVFQRLHRNDEFEGTGVGLAIVQRIIVKHGGRVWAEGETGKGATFYFSLPKPNGKER